MDSKNEAQAVSDGDAYAAVVDGQVVFASANRATVEAWVGQSGIEIRPLSLSAQPAVQVPQWQPIETAPKDGTPILVSNGESTAAVYWWPAVWMGTTHNGMKNPTHWMPLPAPPMAAQWRKA